MKHGQGFYLLLALLVSLYACSSGTEREILPIPALTVAVASFSQPATTTDLLAGTLPEQRKLASASEIAALDALLKAQLQQSNRPYLFLPPQNYLDPLRPDSRGRRSSLATWTWHAQQVGAPLLLTPQIIQWQDQPGGMAQVDYFLIDARTQGELLQRLKFEYQDLWGAELLTQIDQDMLMMIKEFGL